MEPLGPSEAWDAFLGFSVFFAALAAGWAAYGQLKAMRSQLGVMRQQLEDAREAERPWIGFSDPDFGEVRPSMRRKGRFGGRVHLEATNSGRSPARILAWRSAYHYASSFKVPIYGSGRQGRRIVVPGTKTANHLDLVVPSLESENREERLYIFCEITYEDLRTGEEHFTRLCMHAPSPDPAQQLMVRGEYEPFVYDPEYNDAT